MKDDLPVEDIQQNDDDDQVDESMVVDTKESVRWSTRGAAETLWSQREVMTADRHQ
eukprot:CAMPEP_0203892866 /NCGR_PEP_ID=MMETSP0359-20131031/36001_1 /ASSEMBLY_ACC=CAM_ASM_000338 /TAXON_ID=268821 /ORGANISM="Scrippsiella Hangoei, Strain SHTV-5" /LENGTH=55 /DNA_ID=CAMNT_0050814901 /DNA_START=193 /DNA_END=357 /DNA_ORIENTATION=-